MSFLDEGTFVGKGAVQDALKDPEFKALKGDEKAKALKTLKIGGSITTEKKGKDLDGDGDIDSKDYLAARNAAIKKAKSMKEGVAKDLEIKAMEASSLEEFLDDVYQDYPQHKGNFDIKDFLTKYYLNAGGPLDEISEGKLANALGGVALLAGLLLMNKINSNDPVVQRLQNAYEQAEGNKAAQDSIKDLISKRLIFLDSGEFDNTTPMKENAIANFIRGSKYGGPVSDFLDDLSNFDTDNDKNLEDDELELDTPDRKKKFNELNFIEKLSKGEVKEDEYKAVLKRLEKINPKPTDIIKAIKDAYTAGQRTNEDLRGLMAQGEKMAAFANKQSGYEGGVSSPVRGVLAAMAAAGAPDFNGDKDLKAYWTRQLTKAIKTQMGRKYMSGLNEKAKTIELPADTTFTVDLKHLMKKHMDEGKSKEDTIKFTKALMAKLHNKGEVTVDGTKVTFKENKTNEASFMGAPLETFSDYYDALSVAAEIGVAAAIAIVILAKLGIAKGKQLFAQGKEAVMNWYEQNKLNEQEDAQLALPEPDAQDFLGDDGMDYEGGMAKSQMLKMKKYAVALCDMIDDESQLESWVQAKLTKASDYMSSVYHYLDYQKSKMNETFELNGREVVDLEADGQYINKAYYLDTDKELNDNELDALINKYPADLEFGGEWWEQRR